MKDPGKRQESFFLDDSFRPKTRLFNELAKNKEQKKKNLGQGEL